VMRLLNDANSAEAQRAVRGAGQQPITGEADADPIDSRVGVHPRRCGRHRRVALWAPFGPISHPRLQVGHTGATGRP
jgi:hypothetical protein